MFDVAFDFAEDEPRLPLSVAETVRDICIAGGAEARISSIHVNAWFGAYSKADMSRRFLEETVGINASSFGSRVAFIGDSPNDAPMFALAPLSVAVSGYRNLSYLSEHHPAYVTVGDGGEGFLEFAKALLTARRL